MQSFGPQHDLLTVRQALQVSYKQMQMQAQYGNTAFWTVLHLSSWYSLLIACLEAVAIHLRH
jgi:hypothetical protein